MNEFCFVQRLIRELYACPYRSCKRNFFRYFKKMEKRYRIKETFHTNAIEQIIYRELEIAEHDPFVKETLVFLIYIMRKRK